MKFPGQYTVGPTRRSRETVPGTIKISPDGGGKYDLTVVGPNRFLRHFTGDLNTAGRTVEVHASYDDKGLGSKPTLTLELTNHGTRPVTLSVVSNNYANHHAKRYHVAAHRHATHQIDPLKCSDGWYDLTVTIDTDRMWTRRYTGHLEDGTNSITG